MINSQQFFLAGLIYIAIPVVSIFLYRQWEYFGRKGNLMGISQKWLRNFFIGVSFAVGFIIVGIIIPGIEAIGLPNVQSISGTIGRFLIIVIAAPVAEELFFRDLVLDFFNEKWVDLPFFVAALIQAVGFAFYHFFAYGESLQAAGGSFFTAGIAGLGFAYLNKYTKGNASNIGAHITLNIWLGFIKLAVIFGLGMVLW